MSYNGIWCNANLYNHCTLRRSGPRSCVGMSALVLWMFFVKGMHVICFCNIGNVYVCKIGVKMLGGFWLSCPRLVQYKFPVGWPPHCVYECSDESAGPLFQFWVIHRVKYSLLILSFPVLLLQAYEEQCGIYWRDCVVNRRKASLANSLAPLCYDSWTSRQHGEVLRSKVEKEAWFWLVASTKTVPSMVLLDLSTLRPLSELKWNY